MYMCHFYWKCENNMNQVAILNLSYTTSVTKNRQKFCWLYIKMYNIVCVIQNVKNVLIKDRFNQYFTKMYLLIPNNIYMVSLTC